MSFDRSQWRTLSERFNSQSFTGKVLLAKQHKEIFKLEYDGEGNFWLRLKDEDAQLQEFDRLFSFPQNLDFMEMRDLFRLIDLEIFKTP